MAIWGTGSFDNHAAMDWLAWLKHSSGLVELRRALEEAARGVPGRDVVTCRRAVAAAELIAALRGHAAEDLPSEALAWLSAGRGLEPPDESLVTLAVGAVAAIGGESELYSLWCQAHEREEADWIGVIADLSRRLSLPALRHGFAVVPRNETTT